MKDSQFEIFLHLSIKQMIDIISKSFPPSQAIREAKWIQNELPSEKWIDACIKRSNHYPLQYILGNQPFGKLDLKCQPKVLIPRLDTEEWVLQASELLKQTKIDNIVDYCTGSGCIGLTMASELNDVSKIYCIDYKNEAIDLTKENLLINKSQLNVDVEIFKGDIFDGFLPDHELLKNPANKSLLVSNPPYIPKNDLIDGEVETSVLKYEPEDALLGDLEFYQCLTKQLLIPYPAFQAFIFELGYQHQADVVRKILPKDWTVGIRYDSSNHLKNVIGWKKTTDLSILGNMIHKTI
ncbi:hypothetical protein CANINC_001280 [Pichia inconspicua]|uniref:peptide chain release factor N(5)-glutamine methyltransferase n=1 Tax=Pichia inconspicua TaxID=52247 RepID=A0A4T0X400_9ASCO|nr:hypothetical protein CANINC_001280 [[Candida] inconspicua]